MAKKRFVDDEKTHEPTIPAVDTTEPDESEDTEGHSLLGAEFASAMARERAVADAAYARKAGLVRDAKAGSESRSLLSRLRRKG